jgi:DNA-nicking Smr family endonuclease
MGQLASEEVVNHILAHHGIKGMKWGVRRGHSEGVSTKTANPDHTRAEKIDTLLKQKGSKALSNKQIKDLVERKDLENRLAKHYVKPDHLDRLRQGNAAVQDLLKLHGNIKAVASIAKTLKK